MPPSNASVGPWEVTLQNLVTPVGLEISAVRLWGDGARLQTEPFAYEMDGEADVEALILAPVLEAFVRTKVPDNVQDMSLELEPGIVRIVATVKVILPVTATAICTLRLEEGTKVLVELQSVEMLGAGVKSLVQKQLDAINPVLDVSTWPMDVHLTELRVEEGRLVATGKVKPPR